MADRMTGAEARCTVTELRPERVRENLDRVIDRISTAGRDPADVEILAAVKYVPADQLPALAEGGIRVVGENRLQDLQAKQARFGDLFTWDFIGSLQSRKVRDIGPAVRLIHTVASDSALKQLRNHPVDEVLVQVNVAGEEGKGGIAPHDLPGFLERCPVPVGGLMTMPPLVERPEDNRRQFAWLAELAADHGLQKLSMGTSQDYDVAAQEGATIVRLGSILYA